MLTKANYNLVYTVLVKSVETLQFLIFLKEVSYAHHSSKPAFILSKMKKKNSNIVKYTLKHHLFL